MAVTNFAATAYPNEKHGCTLSNGYLVIAYSDTGTNTKFKYSTDSGVTWTDYGSDIAGAANVSLDKYTDSGGTEYVVATWQQSGSGGGRTDQFLYAMAGTLNAGKTTLTWGTASRVGSTFYGTADKFGPDIICHAESTGGQVHVFLSYADSNPYWSTATLTGTTIGAWTNTQLGTGLLGSIGNWPSACIKPSTKDIWVMWSHGDAGSAGKGMRGKKLTYSAGSWTPGTEREIDNSVYMTGTSRGGSACVYDSFYDMFVMGGGAPTNSGGGVDYLWVYVRDAADTTTTQIAKVAADASHKTPYLGNLAVDSATGDIYVVGGDAWTANGVGYQKLTRTSSTAATVGTLVVTDGISIPSGYQSYAYVWFSGSTIRWIYTGGNNSPYSVKYDQLVLNLAPNTPTNLARTAPNTDTTPEFTCDITDPNTGQQIKARFTLYQSDGTTLIGSVDSPLANGPVTGAAASYATPLSVGTYKVQAITVDDLGATSSATSQLTFYVTTSVNADETLLWNVYLNLNKDNTLLWDVYLSLNKDITLLWNAYISLLQDATLLWNVWLNVNTDPTLLWNTYISLNKDNTLLWNVYVSLLQDATLFWNVYIALLEDVVLLWNVYINLHQDDTLIWDCYTNVGAVDRTLIWNTYLNSPKDITLLWDVFPVWTNVSDNTDTPTWGLVNQ